MKYVLFITLAITIVVWSSYRPQWSVYMIVFLSSYSAFLFKDFEIQLSLSALLLLVVTVFKRHPQNKSIIRRGYGKRAHQFKFWHLEGGAHLGIIQPSHCKRHERPGKALPICIFTLLILGLCTGLLNVGESLSINSAQSFGELLNVSMFLVVVYLFVDYSYKTFAAENSNIRILRVFLFSVVLQAVSIFLTISGLNSSLPEFFSGSKFMIFDDTSSDYTSLTARYGGLLLDYELIIDYTLMVIAFSLVYAIRSKEYVLPTLAIMLSFYVSLNSGTRSFFIVLAIAFISLVLLAFRNLKSIKMRIALVRSLLIFAISASALYILYGDNFIVIERLKLAWDILQSGQGLEVASNRSLSFTLQQLISSVSIFGEGSFLFSDLNSNEIVSHNVFFAIYCKYGLVGFAMLNYLIGIVIWRLVMALKLATNDVERMELIVLTAFTFALIFQEMKISALRATSSLLLYTIWFMYIFARISNIAAAREAIPKKQRSTYSSKLAAIAKSAVPRLGIN